MQKGAYILLFTLASFTLSTSNAWGQEVPLISDYRSIPNLAFTSRASISFTVLDCTQNKMLYWASVRAAMEWNKVAPRTIHIGYNESFCDEPLLDISESNIHWSTKHWIEPELGHWDYRMCLLSNRICEEDIEVDPIDTLLMARSQGGLWFNVLYNVVLHEFGHSLGLGDAYRFYGTDECGWSVMLALCTTDKIWITSADLRALNRLYGFISPPSVEPPTPFTPRNSLSRFDANRNGYIDDSEFFKIIDAWIAAEIQDDLFFEAIEAWVGRVKIAGLTKLAEFAPYSIQILDLRGRPVMTQGCRWGRPQTLAQRSLSRSDLPLGLYLAVIRNCETGEAEIEKVTNFK